MPLARHFGREDIGVYVCPGPGVLQWLGNVTPSLLCAQLLIAPRVLCLQGCEHNRVVEAGGGQRAPGVLCAPFLPEIRLHLDKSSFLVVSPSTQWQSWEHLLYQLWFFNHSIHDGNKRQSHGFQGQFSFRGISAFVCPEPWGLSLLLLPGLHSHGKSNWISTKIWFHAFCKRATGSSSPQPYPTTPLGIVVV